jgi:hypothetical protein
LPISLQRKKEKQLKFLKTSMKSTTMHPNRFCVGNKPYYKHPFCISSREKQVQARFSYFGFSLHNSRCYQNVLLPTHRAFGYKGRRHCRSKFDNCRKKIWKTSLYNKGNVPFKSLKGNPWFPLNPSLRGTYCIIHFKGGIKRERSSLQGGIKRERSSLQEGIKRERSSLQGGIKREPWVPFKIE